jgi:hypothetical protein
LSRRNATSAGINVLVALFMIGSFLYGRMPQAWTLAAVFVISVLALAWVLRGLWPETDNS